jgi:hypothetical protein
MKKFHFIEIKEDINTVLKKRESLTYRWGIILSYHMTSWDVKQL